MGVSTSTTGMLWSAFSELDAYIVQCCSRPASRPGRLGKSLRWIVRSGIFSFNLGAAEGMSVSDSETVSERRIRVELYSG